MATPMWKQPKGSALVDARLRRRERVAAEQREMQAALRRDGRRCRFPRCEFASLKLPIDPCHLTHRGMGGDPKGTRTFRAGIVSLCRRHHGMLDMGLIEIQPLTHELADGPCAFTALNQETGRYEHVGTEQRIGVSIAVGR